MNQLTKHNPIIIRSNPEPKKNYLEFRDILRLDFWYSCAYCTISESEALGISFEIDHYYPQEHYHELINKYNNLMWSCEKCNAYKSDYNPDQHEVQNGNVIIRPDIDDPRDHMELSNNKMIEKTHTGRFNIEKLYLNRLMLRRVRELRERLWEASDFIAFGIHKLISVKLDSFRNPKQRILFLHIRGQVFEKYNYVGELSDQLIRDYGRSPLIDEDPEKKKDLKRRREFLREQRTINSDSPIQMLKRGKKIKKS